MCEISEEEKKKEKKNTAFFKAANKHVFYTETTKKAETILSLCIECLSFTKTKVTKNPVSCLR